MRVLVQSTKTSITILFHVPTEVVKFTCVFYMTQDCFNWWNLIPLCNVVISSLNRLDSRWIHKTKFVKLYNVSLNTVLGKQIKNSSFCILKIFLFLKQFNWEATFNTVLLTQYQTLQSLSKIRCCTMHFQPLCSVWSYDETLWKKLIKDILLWKIQLLKRSI